MEERVSELTEAYNKGQSVHLNWKQQQQRVISKFRFIASDIQELERNIKQRSIICLSVGSGSSLMIAAGLLGAPLTFGGSLSLTAVGTGIGLCSGAADALQTKAGNCEIKRKCNEASALLKKIANLTTKLVNLVEILLTIQNVVCEMLYSEHISFSALGSLGDSTSKGCESLVTLIPHIESTSKKLFAMFRGRTTGKVSAPIFGKVTTEVAKKSLRVVGTVAVGISIIADVVTIVNNVRALKEGELSVAVTGIFAAVKHMEKEMERYDKLFAYTA